MVLFEDRDHNGLLKTEAQTDDPEEIEVLQRNLYYPFGMAMEGAWNPDADPQESYLYNGKENQEDFDLNYLDYGEMVLMVLVQP